MRVLNNTNMKAKFMVAHMGLEISEQILQGSQMSVGDIASFEGHEIPRYLLEGSPNQLDT
jgi:hypothetical protein